MSKTDTIHIRIDPSVKENAEKILDKLGLTITDAINVYFNQIIDKKGIPFSLTTREYNDETILAMQEALRICEEPGGFNNVEELKKDLDE